MRRHDARGFTAMELAAASAIATLLSLLLYQAGVTTAHIYGMIHAMGQSEMELNHATDNFTRDVRQSVGIAGSCNGGEFTEDLTSVGESPNGRATLILIVPSIIDGELDFDRFDCVVYDYWEDPDGVLQRSVRTDPASTRTAGDRVVARNVTLVDFNNAGDAELGPPPPGELKMHAEAGVRSLLGGQAAELVIMDASAAWRN